MTTEDRDKPRPDLRCSECGESLMESDCKCGTLHLSRVLARFEELFKDKTW